MENSSQRESVSLWHPWQENRKPTHTLSLFNDFSGCSIDELVERIGNGQQYAFCTDILNAREVQPALLRDRRTEPYLSRTGNVSALRIRAKRKSGFLIPAIQWGEQGNPTIDTLNRVQSIFNIFDMEAITPSSLSEKVLRRTLPDKLYISRPSVMLRRTILENRSVARIMKQKKGVRSEEAYEYDMVKAYLSVAMRGVPTPFIAPVRWYCSDIWQDFPVSFMKVRMTAHVSPGIQPIQLKTETGSRDPMDNEDMEVWCWSGKVQDCLQAGYTVQEVMEGYSWCQISHFMSAWSEILYTTCETYRQEDFYPILKQMTQGLPGRFLKSPEVYTLVHETEYQKGDIPLTANWQGTESPMSEWFMRVDKESEQARETAQLTPIGDYIVSECERAIYKAAREEEHNENRVIRIYVDSVTVTKKSRNLYIGDKPGQFKVKRYWKAVVISNRFLGYNEKGEAVLKAPGYSGKDRKRLVERTEEWLAANDSS